MSGPIEAICASKASFSESCSRVKLWALVPIVGIPQLRPASRLLVASNPAMNAALAAATAADSCALRAPISANDRPPAAVCMREAAAATAES